MTDDDILKSPYFMSAIYKFLERKSIIQLSNVVKLCSSFPFRGSIGVCNIYDEDLEPVTDHFDFKFEDLEITFKSYKDRLARLYSKKTFLLN